MKLSVEITLHKNKQEIIDWCETLDPQKTYIKKNTSDFVMQTVKPGFIITHIPTFIYFAAEEDYTFFKLKFN